MIREVINELKKYTLGKKNTEKVEISVLQLNRVIKALDQEICDTCEHSDEINGSNCYECVKGIRDRYSPQPKTGNWIAQEIHNCHTDFKCSKCGYIHNFMHLYGKPTADYTYCPNCDEKMVEPQESKG